jgi:uncharacterized delta-60 repeat protein
MTHTHRSALFLISFALVGLGPTALVACGSAIEGPASEAEIASIELSRKTIALRPGDSVELEAIARDRNGKALSGVTFEWSSSDTDVAEVSDGVVTAVAVGTARVKARSSGLESASVTVTVDALSTLAAFEISFANDKLPVLQGSEAEVEVTLVRHGDFTGEVSLSDRELPNGVSFDPVTFGPGETKATLRAEARDGAPHSLPTEVTVVGTSGELSSAKSLTVTVYGPAGSLDTSFEGGKVILPAGQGDDYATALALQADGRILIAGRAYENAGDFAVIRLERDGKLDTSFGAGGKVLTDFDGRSDEAHAIAVDENGKIVVAGSSASAGKNDFALVRYTENGELDADFGDGGKVLTSFTDDSDSAFALILEPGGKIVVGGEANLGTSATGQDFALARYNADGSLDPSFGQAGLSTLALASGAGRDVIYALASVEIDGETRLLAAGGEGDFTLARFDENGAPDATFGTGGKVTGLFSSAIGSAYALAVAENGDAIVAGHDTNAFALARLDESGKKVATFGDAGVVVTALNPDNWSRAQGVALEADGKIVLGGWVYEGASSSGNFALARYTAEGALDDGFGTDGGVVVTPMADARRSDRGMAVLLQRDERVPTVRVLVAGEAQGSNQDFVVARFWR